jgi:hypothetical protein
MYFQMTHRLICHRFHVAVIEMLNKNIWQGREFHRRKGICKKVQI